MSKIFLHLITLGALVLPLHSTGQTLSDEEIAAIVLFDSTVVVTAEKGGLNTKDFIRLVRNDSTFFKAFRNLRVASFTAENQIRFFDKKTKAELAGYASKTVQTFDGRCRTMEVLEEQVQGKFFKKNRDYRYYTAKMYDRVFFTHGKVCETAESLIQKEENLKGLEKQYNELKRLIFQPGEKVNVPLIGHKTAIFDNKLSPYYNYFITSKPFENGVDCYVFTVTVKPEYLENKEGKTVIKFLETFFEKSNLQVIGRKYDLTYQGIVDFDVHMEVELTKIGPDYFPKVVKYNGIWNIPTKKAENARFEARFFNISR